MTKTITITDPMKVETGDKAYFENCDFGFTVLDVDKSDKSQPFLVYNPLVGYDAYAYSQQFDHATREVEEPEWPDPHDLRLHVYLGSDGSRYIYNPVNETDDAPWVAEHKFSYCSRENIEEYHHDALPLIELELTSKEIEQ